MINHFVENRTINGHCLAHGIEWTVTFPTSREMRAPGCPACADETRAGINPPENPSPRALELAMRMRKRGFTPSTPPGWALIADIVKLIDTIEENVKRLGHR